MRNYQNNKPTGQAILFATNGDRIEFNYENGVINGKAAIKGSNGDKENCVYVKGVKHGPATYLWKAGHREDFHYDQGNKTGRAVLKGVSGAIREGTKKMANGMVQLLLQVLMAKLKMNVGIWD